MTYKQNIQAILDCNLTEVKDTVKESILTRILELKIDPQPIDYTDCSYSLLKMWLDEILTSDEYYSIMNRLNERRNNEKDNK